MKFKKPVKAEITYIDGRKEDKTIEVGEVNLTDYLKIGNKYFTVSNVSRVLIKLSEFIPRIVLDCREAKCVQDSN